MDLRFFGRSDSMGTTGQEKARRTMIGLARDTSSEMRSTCFWCRIPSGKSLDFFPKCDELRTATTDILLYLADIDLDGARGLVGSTYWTWLLLEILLRLVALFDCGSALLGDRDIKLGLEEILDS